MNLCFKGLQNYRLLRLLDSSSFSAALAGAILRIMHHVKFVWYILGSKTLKDQGVHHRRFCILQLILNQHQPQLMLTIVQAGITVSQACGES